MAKRKAPKKPARAKSGKKGIKARPSVKRPKAKVKARPKAKSKPKARAKAPAKASKRAVEPVVKKRPQGLDRERRQLRDDAPATLRTPPSSLNMDRHASAARSGREELEQSQRQYGKMATVTAGDPDADVDNAYFSGDEAPGGDNPTPDQDVVDEIGHALGVEYADNEELRSGDKLEDRDKHRWELDPASAEDYRDRD